MAISTASEATDRENLDCIQSLLNLFRIKNEANTVIAANFIIIKSVQKDLIVQKGKINQFCLDINNISNHNIALCVCAYMANL